MQLGASQTRLLKIRQREERLLKHLEELDAHLQPRNSGTTDADIVDFQNDVQVRRWVDQRRASVNTELAQTRVLISMAQADLTKHFARQQAAERLVENRATVDRLTETRKTYWGS